MRDLTKRKSVPLRPEKCSVTTGIGDPMKRNLHVANLNINHVDISGNLENRRGVCLNTPLYNK